MRVPDHPGHRPTRYHWAAGINPLHWAPALLGWGGAITTGILAGAGLDIAQTLSLLLTIGTLSWHGLWMIVMPNIPRFKRQTDARIADRYSTDYTYQLVMLAGKIDQDLYDKVDDITRLRDKAREILTTKFGGHDLFAQDNLEKLDSLAISYLQLLEALSEYHNYLSLVNPEDIEKEVVEAEQAVDDADGILKEAKTRQVDLLQNRLKRYREAQSRLKLIQAQCRNVETTMKLLVDQAMTAADPQRVGRDIDQVLENIRASEVLTEELAVYDDLEREIDSMRGKELE